MQTYTKTCKLIQLRAGDVFTVPCDIVVVPFTIMCRDVMPRGRNAKAGIGDTTAAFWTMTVYAVEAEKLGLDMLKGLSKFNESLSTRLGEAQLKAIHDGYKGWIDAIILACKTALR